MDEDNNRVKQHDKKYIDDFNQSEIVGWIVDSMCEIECRIDKKIIEKIRRMSSIRNGFCHSKMRYDITVVFDEKMNSIEKSYLHTTIDIINSQGVIKTELVNKLRDEFYQLNTVVRELFK